MKITTFETVRKETELTFPCYRKKEDSPLFFYVRDKYNCLCVANWQHAQKGIVYRAPEYCLNDTVEITKDEFLAAYKEASHSFLSYLSSEDLIESVKEIPQFEGTFEQLANALNIRG